MRHGHFGPTRPRGKGIGVALSILEIALGSPSPHEHANKLSVLHNTRARPIPSQTARLIRWVERPGMYRPHRPLHGVYVFAVAAQAGAPSGRSVPRSQSRVPVREGKLTLRTLAGAYARYIAGSSRRISQGATWASLPVMSAEAGALEAIMRAEDDVERRLEEALDRHRSARARVRD